MYSSKIRGKKTWSWGITRPSPESTSTTPSVKYPWLYLGCLSLVLLNPAACCFPPDYSDHSLLTSPFLKPSHKQTHAREAHSYKNTWFVVRAHNPAGRAKTWQPEENDALAKSLTRKISLHRLQLVTRVTHHLTWPVANAGIQVVFKLSCTHTHTHIEAYQLI